MSKNRLWMGAFVALWLLSAGCCRFAERWCDRRDSPPPCYNPCYAPPPQYHGGNQQCLPPQQLPPPPASGYCP